MLPHKLTLCFLFLLLIPGTAFAQRAIVVDERLAALRATPQLTGKLVRRLGRGRMVVIRATRRSSDGITFFRVIVTTRTHGWIQREALASPSRTGDDRRLWDLIHHSQAFDRISRARIFLDYFPRSPLRPVVLLLLGDSAEEAAETLSKSAARKFNGKPSAAPEFSYFLNYSGLDRYNRLRVTFVFDHSTKRFHYDGAAWRELIRRYPKSSEAVEAHQRVSSQKATKGYP